MWLSFFKKLFLFCLVRVDCSGRGCDRGLLVLVVVGWRWQGLVSHEEWQTGGLWEWVTEAIGGLLPGLSWGSFVVLWNSWTPYITPAGRKRSGTWMERSWNEAGWGWRRDRQSRGAMRVNLTVYSIFYCISHFISLQFRDSDHVFFCSTFTYR